MYVEGEQPPKHDPWAKPEKRGILWKINLFLQRVKSSFTDVSDS